MSVTELLCAQVKGVVYALKPTRSSTALQAGLTQLEAVKVRLREGKCHFKSCFDLVD